MNYKIVRLQPNHAYYGGFFARLQFGGPEYTTGVLDFTRARLWFADNFGSGCDYSDEWWQQQEPIPAWAWASAYRDYRIYIRDEITLGWFVLSHSCPVDQ
jgi:hypothetical protein